MQWVTPSGFPVANRYRQSETHRVRLKFLGQSVTLARAYKDIADREKVRDSAVANLTHSMDAAHLARSVNRAVEEGITNIMYIHDCAGALAPDVRRFAQVRRWELAKMYGTYNPLAVLLASNPPPDANDLPFPEFAHNTPLPDFDPAFDVWSLGESEAFDR
jgi:Autographiviridae RNA polymerase